MGIGLDQSGLALWGQARGPPPEYITSHRVKQQVRVLPGEREGAGKAVAMAWVGSNRWCLLLLLEAVKS